MFKGLFLTTWLLIWFGVMLNTNGSIIAWGVMCALTLTVGVFGFVAARYIDILFITDDQKALDKQHAVIILKRELMELDL
jgi:hypothetical protein